MPNPVADLVAIQNLLWDELNTATSVYGTFNDDANGNPRWQKQATIDWILDADFRVAKTICESVGHPNRNYYQVTLTGIVSGDALPAIMIGPLQSFVIVGYDGISRPGIPCPTDLIALFNDPTYRNSVYGGALFCDSHYQVIDNLCIFSGQMATLKYCTAARGTTACISPPWFKDTILKLAISGPLLKEEEYVNEGQFFLQQAMADLQSINQRGVIVSPFQQWQQRGQAA